MGTEMEPSTTATVAGEAAAAAVDEIASREAIAERVETAAATAAVAEGTAASSQEIAGVAADIAVEAGQAADNAQSAAFEAAQTAQVAVEVSNDNVSELQIIKTEQAELRQMFGEFLQRSAPIENTDVAEVDVNGGGTANNGNGAGSNPASQASAESAPNKASGRGLRRRSRE